MAITSPDVCGCCAPAAPSTPLTVANRPGLSAIAYRVGTYASFREAMLEALALSPSLARLTTRDADDYGITTLELWAAVADVLTFYQERYANEAYLRTATRRESVLRLARLLDYRPRPGVAPVADLAFTIDTGRSVRVGVGTRVQSVPRAQGEQPQTFETLQAFTASSAWNRLAARPAPVAANPLAHGATRSVFPAGQTGLAMARSVSVGDRCLAFSTSELEDLEVRAVGAEGVHAYVDWKTPIQGSTWNLFSPLQRVGRMFGVFGCTAPPNYATPSADASAPGGVKWTYVVTGYNLGPASSLTLDARYDKVLVGTRLLVSTSTGGGAHDNRLVTVTAVDQVEATLGPLVDTVTRVTISPGLPAIADRRRVRVYELLGTPLRFWGYAYPPRLAGSSVFLPARRVDAQTIEIGPTIVRNELQAGAPVRIEDLELGRRVLLLDEDADVAREPVGAGIAAASVVGSNVAFGATLADQTTAQQLGLSADRALNVRALVGASRPGQFFLTQANSKISVAVGAEGPLTLSLAIVTSTSVPADVYAADSALDSAFSTAAASSVFRQTRVTVVDDRLVIVAPDPEATVRISPAADDPTTAAELGIGPGQAQLVGALLSGPLPTTPAVTNPHRELQATLGWVGPRTVHLTHAPLNLTQATLTLESALHSADPTPAFIFGRVRPLGSRLLVLAGPVGDTDSEFLSLSLQPDSAIDLASRSAVLLGNVAPASQGESVRDEPLGDGDASKGAQRMALKKSPLTYVPSATAGGVSSTLQVIVDGVRWSEVPGLYGQPADAQVYSTRLSAEDGATTLVQFGNGTNGARLPTGRGNVRATYRMGAGLAGRVPATALSTALDRPPGLQGVLNPAAARGGADPETLDSARYKAPSTVRTFGRAVSLRDFEDLVMESGEVAKSRATWAWEHLSRTIHVTVAAQQGATFASADLQRLTSALNSARDPNHQLRLDNYRAVSIVLAATLRIEAAFGRDDVRAAARTAILSALSFDALQLGQSIHLSDVYRVLQEVRGVESLDVDELGFKQPADMSALMFLLELHQRGVVRLPSGSPAPLQPHLRVFPTELARIASPDHDVTLTAIGGLTT